MKFPYLKQIAVICTVLAVFCTNAAAQGQRVSVNFRNARLATVLESIEKQVGKPFFYEEGLIAPNKRVTVTLEDSSLDAVLGALFDGRIAYSMVEGHIVLRMKEQGEASGNRQTGSSPEVRPAAQRPPAGASTQQKTFRVGGRVTGADDGKPLAFVNVTVKGTTVGTSTDSDGFYAINVPEGSATLVFSFIGFEREETRINGRSEIDVRLRPESTALEEVVVIGYGSQSTKNLTTSVSSVKSDIFKDIPVASFQQALQGKMPGVHITAASGNPGAPMVVSIRGRSSISAGNSPLYVIDGVPVSTDKNFFQGADNYSVLANLNADDVESVDVLKDAAAAAIYGSRGSNGVILITTKRGRLQDNKSINFSAYYGFQSPVRRMDMLNASEYRNMVRESYINAGLESPFTEQEAANPTVNTDWMDQIHRDNSYVQNYQVSASGGNNAMSYYASLGYFKQDNLLLKGGFERYSGRLNVDHKFSDHLKLGASMGFSRGNHDQTQSSGSIYSPWMRGLMARPDEAVYKDNGEFNDGSYDNPVKMFLPEWTTTISNALGNFFAEVAPLKGLTFRSAFGIDYSLFEDSSYSSSKSYGGESTSGKAEAGANRSFNWIATQTLQYRNNFLDERLSADLTFVYEYQEREFNTLHGSTSNFPSDETKYLSSGATIVSLGSTWTGNRLESYLGRANFAWESKYLLGFSVRADGSSKFPKSGRWGYFPSVSAGWNIDEEAFMDGLFISTAKLRVSYGRTGNQEGIGDFAYLRSFVSSGGFKPAYNSNPGFVVSGLGSPNLTWEKTDQLDIGLDLGFLNNRLNLQIDLYRKHTKDLLLNKPIPSTTGFNSRLENVGEIEGKGVDISVRSVNFEGAFSWTTSLTASFYKNEIMKLYNGQPIPGTVTRHAEGQAMGSFFLVKALGVDPQTGDMIYEDISGPDGKSDGEITDEDRQFVGDPFPSVQGGLTNSLNWKGFDLDIFFQYVFGAKIYKGYEAGSTGVASLGASSVAVNVFRDVYNDRWTTPGQKTDVPRALVNDTHNTRTSSRFLRNSDYVRLKNVTLGYTLPSRLTSKLGIKNARIYVSGQNLLTFTKYDGFDPEISFKSDPLNYGVDSGEIPQMKSVMFGINLTF